MSLIYLIELYIYCIVRYFEDYRWIVKQGNNMRDNHKTTVNKLGAYFYAVRDQYFKVLDKIWSVIPNFIGTLIATIIVFIAGSTMRGK